MRGFLILDFGSQVTQLIARRLRELNVFSEILPYDVTLEEIQQKQPLGIILSGGPQSVNGGDAPLREVQELLDLCPVMGICYGMQLMAQSLGGKVESAEVQEYGHRDVIWKSPLFEGAPEKQTVWMSHGDVVKQAPPTMEIIAHSDSGHPAAMKGERVLAVQFHPEVTHTTGGTEILKNFVFDMCQAPADWKPEGIKEQLSRMIKETVPDGDHVLCALSGGVDSTVVATLCTKVLGKDRVHCVFVNNGLLRLNEFEEVLETYKQLDLNVTGVDAEETFLSALDGVSDPEKKRKIIGNLFIDVFDDHVKKANLSTQWLAQGTLYPDVIESVSLRGENVTIKSHHNVGGLPAKMKMSLLEPVRELFKDEVRALGRELGIPEKFLGRHPFPGPGLGIRILGAVNKEMLGTLKKADAIFREELVKHNIYDEIWQAFCVLLPVKTVGVQGDARTYAHVLSLRAVTSSDAMTANWYPFTFDFLQHVSNRITNEVKDINRVVYDVTSKPPGTIEWE